MATTHHELNTPRGRRRAMRYHFWIDHEFLRYPWTNFDEVAPGVYRSNHPTRARLQALASRGVNTIISLRGGRHRPHHLLESEACHELGLTFHCIPMSARDAPTLPQLSAVFELLDRLDPPFLIHCKSGADRTGLVSALYLLHYQGVSLDDARRQLSFRYLHLKITKTGILDHFLEAFAVSHERTGIGIRDWIFSSYDPDALAEDFARHGLKG